ncbi:MAG: hypothetical protein ACP5D2_02770 [Candidatus Nanoarchaeia archaeon]
MFNKNKKEKLVKYDIGFAEDAFELLKNATATEGHFLGNYCATGDEKYLDKLEKARKRRTVFLDMVFQEVAGKEPEGHSWCISKHIPNQAMICQELITRFLGVGDKESAKKLIEQYKDLYQEYLELLDIKEGKGNIESQA